VISFSAVRCHAATAITLAFGRARRRDDTTECSGQLKRLATARAAATQRADSTRGLLARRPRSGRRASSPSAFDVTLNALVVSSYRRVVVFLPSVRSFRMFFRAFEPSALRARSQACVDATYFSLFTASGST
jgi:hypothetical protein